MARAGRNARRRYFEAGQAAFRVERDHGRTRLATRRVTTTNPRGRHGKESRRSGAIPKRVERRGAAVH